MLFLYLKFIFKIKILIFCCLTPANFSEPDMAPGDKNSRVIPALPNMITP